jgi:nucleoid DNA-binding protein
MGGQGRAQIGVHRGVVESHGQHVGHGRTAAADHLDTGLRAGHGLARRVDRLGRAADERVVKGLYFWPKSALIVPLPTDGPFFAYHLTQRKRTMAKVAAPTKPLTKTELLANIAAAADLPKTQIAAVLESLAAEIQKSLGNKGPGAITIPGLVKIEKKKVPARPAQKGVPNPFKPGELMDRPAKPAYNKVKVRALKLLKDMAK